MTMMQRLSFRLWAALASLAMIATVLMTSAPANSQEATAQGSNEEQQNSQENSTTASDTGSSTSSGGSASRRAGDKGGVFRPSEDISEDVAITFPVDI